jgi:hypothetical protein
MTATQWLAFVIVPVAVAILGWVIVFVNEWANRRADKRQTASAQNRPGAAQQAQPPG